MDEILSLGLTVDRDVADGLTAYAIRVAAIIGGMIGIIVAICFRIKFGQGLKEIFGGVFVIIGAIIVAISLLEWNFQGHDTTAKMNWHGWTAYFLTYLATANIAALLLSYRKLWLEILITSSVTLAVAAVMSAFKGALGLNGDSGLLETLLLLLTAIGAAFAIFPYLDERLGEWERATGRLPIRIICERARFQRLLLDTKLAAGGIKPLEITLKCGRKMLPVLGLDVPNALYDVVGIETLINVEEAAGPKPKASQESRARCAELIAKHELQLRNLPTYVYCGHDGHAKVSSGGKLNFYEGKYFEFYQECELPLWEICGSIAKDLGRDAVRYRFDTRRRALRNDLCGDIEFGVAQSSAKSRIRRKPKNKSRDNESNSVIEFFDVSSATAAPRSSVRFTPLTANKAPALELESLFKRQIKATGKAGKTGRADDGNKKFLGKDHSYLSLLCERSVQFSKQTVPDHDAKPVGMGVVTLLIFVLEDGSARFLLLRRSRSGSVGEAIGMTSVVPGGSFQPTALSGTTKNGRITYNVIRELAEEIYGIEPQKDGNPSGLPATVLTQEFTAFANDVEALILSKSSGLRLFYLGTVLDIVTGKLQFMTSLVVPADLLADEKGPMYIGNWKSSVEGEFEIFPFEKQALAALVEDWEGEQLISDSLGALAQAHSLFEELQMATKPSAAIAMQPPLNAVWHARSQFGDRELARGLARLNQRPRG